MTSRRWAALAGAGLLAAASVNLWHARASSAPPSFDEAWYFEVSCRLWDALAHAGPWAFAKAFAASFRFKAPLAAALPLPLYAVTGPSFAAAVTANAGALALLSVSLFGLGRRLRSPAAGGLAVAFALTMPLTATLSRTFFVETWLTAFTAAFLWRLEESDQLRDRREAALAGLVFGLGLLTKVIFPGIVAAPLAYALWRRRADPRGPDLPGLERSALAFAACAAAPALTWYAPNLVTVAAFAILGYRGRLAAAYGSTDAWDPAEVARYAHAMARQSVSWWALALLVGLLAFHRRRSWSFPAVRLAAVWVLPYLLITTSGYAKDQRYVSVALPGVALALGALLDSATEGRRARPLLLASALAPMLYLYALLAFGRESVPPPPAWAAELFPDRVYYGGPPDRRGRWGQDALTAEVARRVPAGSVVVLGSEHLFLNANILSASAARQRLPVSFIHYGHMEDRVDNTLARFVEKDATHILFVDGLDPKDLPAMVPKVDAALKDLARAGRIPFRRLGPVPAAGPFTAELWERTGPIRMVGVR